MSRPIVFCLPGRYGDQIWGLVTARALAESVGEPITLCLSQKYSGLAELIGQQEYVKAVEVAEDWVVEESAPITPRLPPLAGQYCVSGAYLGWPERPLPYEVERIVHWEHPDLLMVPINLSRPWITVQGPAEPSDVAVGFSDEWFELKVGLAELVEQQLQYTGLQCFNRLVAPGSRWAEERGVRPCSWVEAAGRIRNSDYFLGCCSALHVLAVALGVPAVVVEPNPMRHNPCFWPLGMDGPQVTCVKGGDGKPTHDARHTADVLRAVLKARA